MTNSYQKLLIADLDGCLVETRALHYDCLNEALVANRFPPIPRAIHLSTYDGLPTMKKLTMLGIEGQNCPGSKFYLIDGQHLDGVPDGEYDLVYSTIAFQHIAHYEVRKTLLREFCRVLRPGGRIALQTVFSTEGPDVWNEGSFNNFPKQHVEWTDSGEILDIQDVALYLGVSKATIYRWVNGNGCFPAHHCGSKRGDYRFYPDEINHWVQTYRGETDARRDGTKG